MGCEAKRYDGQYRELTRALFQPKSLKQDQADF